VGSIPITRSPEKFASLISGQAITKSAKRRFL